MSSPEHALIKAADRENSPRLFGLLPIPEEVPQEGLRRRRARIHFTEKGDVLSHIEESLGHSVVSTSAHPTFEIPGEQLVSGVVLGHVDFEVLVAGIHAVKLESRGMQCPQELFPFGVEVLRAQGDSHIVIPGYKSAFSDGAEEHSPLENEGKVQLTEYSLHLSEPLAALGNSPYLEIHSDASPINPGPGVSHQAVRSTHKQTTG